MAHNSSRLEAVATIGIDIGRIHSTSSASIGMARSYILPYATKQGIFRDISGRFFEGNREFNRADSETADAH